MVYIKYSNIDTFTKIDDVDENLEEILRYNQDEISQKLNLNFTEIQFHNDYRDVITSFNNVAPAQRQIFNLEYSPVTFKVLKGFDEVKRLIKYFVSSVNANIDKEPEIYDTTGGWDNYKPEKKVKSGWDKQMEALGVSTSLYDEPKLKSKIKLVAINRVEKFESDNQVKYVCFLFLQKLNVTDQMVLSVSFVLDKNDVNLDRDLFKLENEPIPVVIENIFVVGFMTKDMSPNHLNSSIDKFYHYDELNNDTTDIVDNKTIMKQLLEKYKQKNREMKNFNASLDTDGQVQKNVPSLAEYDSYQATRTIMDDMTLPANFS